MLGFDNRWYHSMLEAKSDSVDNGTAHFCFVGFRVINAMTLVLDRFEEFEIVVQGIELSD